MKDLKPTPPVSEQLLNDPAHLIDSTRHRVARTVNAELVLMYWKIGARIRQEILGVERAAYGTGFSRGNLFHLIRFADRLSSRMRVSGRHYIKMELTVGERQPRYYSQPQIWYQ